MKGKLNIPTSHNKYVGFGWMKLKKLNFKYQYNNGRIFLKIVLLTLTGAQLVSVDGETTSHLMGTFYRTIRLVENGIKPVYIFDGKPPDMKSHQLNKRAERREEAEKELQKATEAGDYYNILYQLF